MIEIPIEDWVFVLCVLVGGGLLLVTVLLDDILGGVLEFLNIEFDLGGVSLMPLMLGFISMFGVGGLFATQVLDVHGAQAAVVGTISGGFGFAIVYGLFSIFRRSEAPPPFRYADLIGSTASVAVAIPAGRFGSVYVRAEGQTREITATASVDLPSGTPVTITATTGTGLVVGPVEQPVTANA
jgi:membrane protein implicated in regulation of membrane protease activity